MAHSAQLQALAATLGFAFRRAHRLLPEAPRRAVIVDHLIVALELANELYAHQPEFVEADGLPLLVRLAGGSTRGERPRPAVHRARRGARGAFRGLRGPAEHLVPAAVHHGLSCRKKWFFHFLSFSSFRFLSFFSKKMI